MEEVKLKAQCNKCLGETNHLLLHEEDQPWEEEGDGVRSSGYHGSDTFKLVKCCGCDSVKLMHTSWFSEYCDEYDSPIIDTNYYPPVISRAEPQWVSSLGGFCSPEHEKYLLELLREIYSALHNDSRRLAVMGIRALLEYIMIAKVDDQGTFKKNLDLFQKKGYLSEKQRKIIEPIFEAGHAAIHRAYHPSSEDVLTIIEVTESLVETIYVHPEKASKLEGRVPKRG